MGSRGIEISILVNDNGDISFGFFCSLVLVEMRAREKLFNLHHSGNEIIGFYKL